MPEDGQPVRPVFSRINVAEVTPSTAPPYVRITHTERNSRHVLAADDGTGLLLIGQLGVNYFPDGPGDQDGIYLRRYDVPPRRVTPRP